MSYIRVLLLCLCAINFGCSAPSDNTVRSEFKKRYPTLEVNESELIFEQNGVAVYLVSAKGEAEVGTGKYDFALRRSFGKWEWCDDHSKRKCK